MNKQLKISLSLVVVWLVFLFTSILTHSGGRFIRWLPILTVFIFGYLIYASIKIWKENKNTIK